MRIDDCYANHLDGLPSGPYEIDVGEKARWVAALRSGQYAQAHGSLKTEDGYCCLGVLCELHGAEVVVKPDGSYSYVFYAPYPRYSSSSIPRSIFRDWTGLRGDAVAIQNVLMRFNDGIPGHAGNGCPGHTFHEISDWVEEYL